MRYAAVPGVGVGTVRFGMTIEEVHVRLGEPDEEGFWETTRERQDWWENDGLSVLFDAEGRCVEIALFAPATVSVSGKRLLGVPREDALCALRELDADADEEDGLLVSAELGIALTRNEDDELEFLMLAPGRMDEEPVEGGPPVADGDSDDGSGEDA